MPFIVWWEHENPMSLKVDKAAGALGAFVSGANLADIASHDALAQQVRDLAVAHEVIFLRDQHVDASTFADFAARFGTIMDHGAYGTVKEAPSVQVLKSTAQAPSKIEVWHSDMTFAGAPPSFTLLHGQLIPAFGGDTLWASASAAFTALSPPMQTFLSGLHAEHDFCHGFRESLAEPGGRERLADTIAANPPRVHPVVRIHPESGKSVIYVNALFTTKIVELSALESERLLSFLYAHIVTHEFTVRLGWAPGTVAIWDNRSTQHKPVNDYFPQARTMHRVTIVGDTPK